MVSCFFWLNIRCLFTGSLIDKKGKILIPGLYEAVAPVTDEELTLYEKIDFDLEEYAKDVGATKLLHDTKVYCIPFSPLWLAVLVQTILEDRNKLLWILV